LARALFKAFAAQDVHPKAARALAIFHEAALGARLAVRPLGRLRRGIEETSGSASRSKRLLPNSVAGVDRVALTLLVAAPGRHPPLAAAVAGAGGVTQPRQTYPLLPALSAVHLRPSTVANHVLPC
jgi:hypothetical protein